MLGEDQSEQKISKYNAAIDQLLRIGELWRHAHTFSMRGNYDGWNKALDEVWKELAGDIKHDDKRIKEYLDINIELCKVFPLAIPNNFGFNKAPIHYTSFVSKQYSLLTQKEIFLRRLQNSLGKGTAYKDESEDDFE